VTQVDWTSLCLTLERLERLGDDESGLLTFGQSDVGAAFVEKGRVCWIAARGLGQRLSDLLVSACNIERTVLESVFERCARDGKLVGQALVAEGLIGPAELERALRRHSAECLLEPSREPLPTRWATHAGRGYAPRFTFRALDLLFDAVGLVFPEQQARARQELATLQAPGRRGAAFVYDPTQHCLLPAADTGGHGVGSLRTLAAVARVMPRASLELAATPSFTLAATDDGRSVAVWWKDGLLFAVPCEDRPSLAAVTSRVLAAA
jgi:hypothetical protein